MASNHHQQCHCHPTPPIPTPTYYYPHPTQPTPTPTTTTCYYTTTHYSPPPPPDPLVHFTSSHYHAPPHAHLHAPTQTHHAPHQIHQNDEQNPTVTSLIHRITALETTLRRRNNQSLRNTAARTIQTHFRKYLVQRSITLRHLKDLAVIKSALNNLKSSVSNKTTHFDSYFISTQSINLLIKLDSIQGSDPMIRDGKRSITRELIRFMDSIDQVSVKNVRFTKTMSSAENERKLAENLRRRINKIRLSAVPKTEEDEVESLEIENVRKHGGLTKSQRVVKSQPKVKKSVSFDDNGNVYRIIKRNRGIVLSDGSDSSIGDEEVVEEIGVSSKETEVVVEDDDSSEMSENEMDPRKNLSTLIHHTTQKNQRDQEVDEDDDDDEEEEEDEEDDSFVLSAPLPAKMEYRVDSVNKKQTTKH